MSELSKALTKDIEAVQERLIDLEEQYFNLRMEQKELEGKLEELDDQWYAELERELKADGVDIKDTPFYREEVA